MVKIIVGLMGSTAYALSSELSTPEQLKGLLSVLKQHNVHELDTARLYQGGKSEELLGKLGTETLASGPFSIATKAPAFMPETLTYDKIVNNCNASLEALKASSVDLYYLHGPDRETPLEESCRAIQDLFKQGKFARWGLSNLHVDEVNEIIDICARNGWGKPSVYQGVYNPIMRSMEKHLLPTLRKHGMTFYAYSPVAGGYFTKPVEQLREPPADSRMEKMKVFHSMYINDVSLKLREKLDKVCQAQDVSVMDATFRWMMHHSALREKDGIVLGGGSTAQFEENLKACEERPLPQAVVDAFEDLWREYVDAGKALTYCIPRDESERLHS